MSDGNISIHAPLKPLNNNPRGYITENQYIKGADQIFQSIADLIAFHPDKMVQGMTARVMNYPTIGDVTEYFLNAVPTDLLDSSNDSIVTLTNFKTYWTINNENNTGQETTREYAPSKANGARPSFPYTVDSEAIDGWTPVYDPALNHQWVRFRTDDTDNNGDGIFDNWSIPIQVGNQYLPNDYIENRFIRQDVDNTIRSNELSFQVDKYYIVLTETITVNDVVRTIGSKFIHAAANTYSFSPGATAQETLIAPPSVDSNGDPNNEPIGYSDTIPSGTEQLWVIEAQKNLYGQLKSDWVIRRITEDPQYIRYSSVATPDPNSIVGIGVSSASGTQGDTDLEAVGWSKTYNNQEFIATRTDNNSGASGPPFSQWSVLKINQESGEFQDFVFKLFDFNLAVGDPALVAPFAADPTDEGWFDVPQPETNQKRLWVSSARKFNDGTLKTPWSDPVPYSAFDTYQVIVSSTHGSFKTDQDSNVTPTEIDLTAKIYKGITELWEDADVDLTFSWKRVYNNGIVVDDTADGDTGDDFYLLGESGTASTNGYFHSGQRLRIKPEAVTGQAVFRVTIVVNLTEGDDITFTEEISILDVSDGIDTKTLVLTADSPLFLKQSEDQNFQNLFPSQVVIRSYSSNLGSGDYTWETRNETNDAWITLKVGSDTTLLLEADGENVDIESGLLDNIFQNINERTFRVTHPDLPNGDQLTIFQQSTNTKNGDRYSTTSSDSFSIPAGASEARSFSVDTALAYTAGQTVLVYRDVSNSFQATITSYDSATGAMVVSSTTTISGSGTHASWLINLAGAAGSPGSDGTPGTDGNDAPAIVLSNEAHTVVIDPLTDQPVSGETGTSGRALTKVYAYSGNTQIAPASYTISNITGSVLGLTANQQINGSEKEVYLTAIPLGFDSGYIEFDVAFASITFKKRFSISTVRDGAGAILFLVSSDKGRQFTPEDRSDKVLTAELYNDGILQTSGYEYNFQIAGSFLGWTSTRTQVITRANVKTQSSIVVQVRPAGGSVIRTWSEQFSDITDAQIIRLWTDSDPVTSADKPTASHISNTGVTVGSVVWRTITDSYWNSNDPVWATEGNEDPATINQFIWSTPYKIQGESGSQGVNGGFLFNMYKVNGTTLPSTTASLSAMLTAGWTSKPPAAANVYVTQRFWQGEDGSGNDVTFNISGDPNTEPFTGTTWSNPTTFTGANGNDGLPGNDGNDGVNGWNPVLAVVTDGTRRVHQVVDWTGGGGTKPTTGVYLGASGFTTNIASATDIRGAAGNQGATGPTSDYVHLTLSDTLSSNGNVYRRQGLFTRSDITPSGLSTKSTFLVVVRYKIRYVGSDVPVWMGSIITEGSVVRASHFDVKRLWNYVPTDLLSVSEIGSSSNERYKTSVVNSFYVTIPNDNFQSLSVRIRSSQVSSNFNIQEASAVFIPVENKFATS